MPLIEVPTEEDRMLEQVVPAYLRGEKKTTQRVRWAIEKLTDLLRQQKSDKPPRPANPDNGELRG